LFDACAREILQKQTHCGLNSCRLKICATHGAQPGLHAAVEQAGIAKTGATPYLSALYLLNKLRI
jgi:hypothetical protein